MCFPSGQNVLFFSASLSFFRISFNLSMIPGFKRFASPFELTDVRNNQLRDYIMFDKNSINSEHLLNTCAGMPKDFDLRWKSDFRLIFLPEINVPNMKPVLFRIYVPKSNCSEHTNSPIGYLNP